MLVRLRRRRPRRAGRRRRRRRLQGAGPGRLRPDPGVPRGGPRRRPAADQEEPVGGEGDAEELQRRDGEDRGGGEGVRRRRRRRRGEGQRQAEEPELRRRCRFWRHRVLIFLLSIFFSLF